MGVERVFKNIHKTQMQPLTTTPAGTPNTDGFREHSCNGGSLYYKRLILQKIIHFGGVPPTKKYARLFPWGKILTIENPKYGKKVLQLLPLIERQHI